MNATNETPANLRKYTLANTITRDEAINLLKGNMSKCPDIKDIAAFGVIGIKLQGKLGKYTVICGKNNLITVMASSPSNIVIGFICGIIPGIFYAIQYNKVKPELATVLPFIYETLNSKR